MHDEHQNYFCLQSFIKCVEACRGVVAALVHVLRYSCCVKEAAALAVWLLPCMAVLRVSKLSLLSP